MVCVGNSRIMTEESGYRGRGKGSAHLRGAQGTLGGAAEELSDDVSVHFSLVLLLYVT